MSCDIPQLDVSYDHQGARGNGVNFSEVAVAKSERGRWFLNTPGNVPLPQTSFCGALTSISATVPGHFNPPLKQRPTCVNQSLMARPRHKARRLPENPTNGCERHAAEDKGPLYVNRDECEWQQAKPLKILPIMQADKGLLFKNPQPIC